MPTIIATILGVTMTIISLLATKPELILMTVYYICVKRLKTKNVVVKVEY